VFLLAYRDQNRRCAVPLDGEPLHALLTQPDDAAVVHRTGEQLAVAKAQKVRTAARVRLLSILCIELSRIEASRLEYHVCGLAPRILDWSPF
jgi:hypothetical protein